MLIHIFLYSYCKDMKQNSTTKVYGFIIHVKSELVHWLVLEGYRNMKVKKRDKIAKKGKEQS